MIFNQGYFSSMDRGYMPMPNGPDPGTVNPVGVASEMGEISMKELGISAPPMQGQLEGLRSKIFQGASKVELGVMGRGKGSMAQGNTTPEMFGMDERMAMRELARINEVQLSMHAGLHSSSLAGLSEGRFDEHMREQNLNEIRRAIDFASDVSDGGAVVFHAFEFPRPVSESPLSQIRDSQGNILGYRFKAYPEEEKRAPKHLVDNRNGQVIESVRKDTPIVSPVWQTDPKTGLPMETPDGSYIPIYEQPQWEEQVVDGRRVRVMKGGGFKTTPYDWSYFEKQAALWNKYKREAGRPERTPEEQYYHEQLQNRIAMEKSYALYYSERYQDSKRDYGKLQNALEHIEAVEAATPPEERWKLLETAGISPLIGGAARYISPERKMPSELIKDAMQNLNREIGYIEGLGSSYLAQAGNLVEQAKHIQPIEAYAVLKAADTIAQAGVYSWQKTEQMKRQEHNQGTEIRPLFAAVENAWMPDQYGSHPQELKRLVLDARKNMMNKLVNTYGYKGREEEANRLAEEHIKATFDIGHANTWRKYFQGDPNKTFEQNEAQSKQWLLNEVDDLVKHKVIGHVHIADNFGYEDEHVSPGLGNAPIKEFMQKMKKAGIKTQIIEPAHQDFRALLQGWELAGSPIYAAIAPSRGSWSDTWQGYFGANQSPYFLVGDVVPDREAWTLWSQAPLE